eukprot:TRINITY_DN28179_c0_g1_i1.p1 TRINITY_DN28179_c0_g1~~TRINITY_DN28179_c0_g1_i1.p1  ORF type:complete len:576 (+),score=146.96 TRINITY_DN28179_c0_g1_i1:36-1763(+)
MADASNFSCAIGQGDPFGSRGRQSKNRRLQIQGTQQRRGHHRKAAQRKEVATAASGIANKRHNNWKLLDLVLGAWEDQNGSTYSVQLDGGRELNSCSVFTTRPSGRTICTKGLIAVRDGQVFWASTFILAREAATPQAIQWVHKEGGNPFNWTRRTSPLKKGELRLKILAERSAASSPTEAEQLGPRKTSLQERAELKKRLAAERKAFLQSEDVTGDTSDFENESDDDDIECSATDVDSAMTDRVRVPVDDIRWCHDTLSVRFRVGKLLVDTLEEMLGGSLQPEDLPPFKVVLHDDLLFSVTGNRRLWVLKEFGRLTGKQVMVEVKCYPPSEMKKGWCKMRHTTKNEGVAVDFVPRRSAKTGFAKMQDALQEAGLEEHAASLPMWNQRMQQAENIAKFKNGELPTPPGGWWELSTEQAEVNDQEKALLASLLSSDAPDKAAAERVESKPTAVAKAAAASVRLMLSMPGSAHATFAPAMQTDHCDEGTVMQRQVIQRLQELQQRWVSHKQTEQRAATYNYDWNQGTREVPSAWGASQWREGDAHAHWHADAAGGFSGTEATQWPTSAYQGLMVEEV